MIAMVMPESMKRLCLAIASKGWKDMSIEELALLIEQGRVDAETVAHMTRGTPLTTHPDCKRCCIYLCPDHRPRDPLAEARNLPTRLARPLVADQADIVGKNPPDED